MNIKVIPVTFELTNKTKYKYTVNSNTSIKSLKKLIIAGANLKKGITLKIKDKILDEKINLNDLTDYISENTLIQVIINKNVDIEQDLTNQGKSSNCLDHGNENTFYCTLCQKEVCVKCLRAESQDNCNHISYDKDDFVNDCEIYLQNTIDNQAKEIDVSQYKNQYNKVKNTALKNKINDLDLSLNKKLVDIEKTIDNFVSDYDANKSKILVNAEIIKKNTEFVKDLLGDQEILGDFYQNNEIFLNFQKKIGILESYFKNVTEVNKKLDLHAKNFEDHVNKNIISSVEDDLSSYNTDSHFPKFVDLENSNILPLRLDQGKIIHLLNSSTPNISHDFGHLEETPIVKKSISNIKFSNEFQMNNPISFIERTPTLDKSTLSCAKVKENHSHQCKIVMSPIEKTPYILFYYDCSDKVKKTHIKNIPLSNFLEGCSFLNFKGKLYISGGKTENGEIQKNFLVFDYKTRKITKIEDLNIARTGHSTIYYEGYIYSVGGTGSNTSEKYDLSKNYLCPEVKTISDIGELVHPILFIYNTSSLFSFFGQNNGKFVEEIYRLDINDDKSEWQIFPYKKGKFMRSLFSYGSGIIQANSNQILFFGGYNAIGLTDDVKVFDFEDRSFYPISIKCEDKVLFKESMLYSLENGYYGNFNIDQNIFMKIQIQK